jgi:amino-acid N-acetyltransferase
MMTSLVRQQSVGGEPNVGQPREFHAAPRLLSGDGVALCPARRGDVRRIEALINQFAAEGIMLPRSAPSIELTLEDFVVAVGDRGHVLGCGALREYSPSLAEVASLAVAREAHGRGIGTAVIRRLEALARLRGVSELFALTLAPRLFEGAGYRVVERARYPEKIRRDCAVCARRSDCREVCVARSLSHDRPPLQLP